MCAHYAAALPTGYCVGIGTVLQHTRQPQHLAPGSWQSDKLTACYRIAPAAAVGMAPPASGAQAALKMRQRTSSGKCTGGPAGTPAIAPSAAAAAAAAEPAPPALLPAAVPALPLCGLWLAASRLRLRCASGTSSSATCCRCCRRCRLGAACALLPPLLLPPGGR